MHYTGKTSIVVILMLNSFMCVVPKTKLLSKHIGRGNVNKKQTYNSPFIFKFFLPSFKVNFRGTMIGSDNTCRGLHA